MPTPNATSAPGRAPTLHGPAAGSPGRSDASGELASGSGRPARPERPARLDRPGRLDRPARPDRPDRLGRRVRRGAVPVLLALAAFGAAAFGTGPGAGVGAGLDPGLVPIVRFMAVTKLLLALCTAVAVGVRYGRTDRGRRLVAGLVASLCMAAGAGLIWSAAAFGPAFAAFLTGATIVALLVVKELGSSLRRRP